MKKLPIAIIAACLNVHAAQAVEELAINVDGVSSDKPIPEKNRPMCCNRWQ